MGIGMRLLPLRQAMMASPVIPMRNENMPPILPNFITALCIGRLPAELKRRHDYLAAARMRRR
jgi:hypothetical protein